MRLSRLVLCGFKSFADRTEFTFDDPVTGIVGPNGCGKSNVVDAIKWVLGERSSKSLRGKEMIDVIFAGSAGRKPSGMASVTLCFENPVVEEPDAPSDGTATVSERPTDAQPADALSDALPEPSETLPDPITPTDAPGEEPSEVILQRAPGGRRRALPIDADTVDVERRLYRDGTSQYLINSKRARLKDIRDLFLDTGVGADAYSIIEQGKVDAMLLASPQERRAIFEEAAGVARYKARRVEAQRKLERAQQNLVATRQQLESTERRLRIVRSQAAKARKFKELDSALRAARMALAFDQYDDIRRLLDGLTSSQTQLDGRRAEATALVSGVEHAKQEAELTRHDLTVRQRSLDERLAAARHARQSAEQRRQMTARALEEAQRQAERDSDRLEETKARAAEAATALGHQGETIGILSERLADADRAVEQAGAERSGVLEQLVERRAALGQKQSTAASIDRDLAGLAAAAQSDRTRADSVSEETARLESRSAATGADRARLAESLAAADQAATDRRARVEQAEQDSAAHDAAAAALSEDRRELSGHVAALEQQHLRLDGRRQALREMVEARVGLGDAPRAVLEARDSGRGFAGIVGALSDLIETDGDHAPAVEAALGEALQALVVASVGAMPAQDELASLTGRVTFIPLNPLAGNASALFEFTHRAAIEAAATGRMTPLRDVVRSRDSADATEALLDRLLGATHLVEGLDQALLLSGAAPGLRFVTLDGSVLEPDGRVTAGPAKGVSGETPGLLQRRSELVALETETAAAGSTLAEGRDRLRAADAEAAALSTRCAEARAALQQEHKRLIADEARVQQLRSELARLDRDAAHLGEEIEQARARVARLEADLVSLEERSDRLRRLHEEVSREVATLREELERIQARADAAGELMTTARVESSRLGEQLTAARREHRSLQLAVEETERHTRDLRLAVEQSLARAEEHLAAIGEAERQGVEAAAAADSLAVEAESIKAEVDSASAAIAELAERLAAARKAAHIVERDWNSLEISRREAEVKRENLEQRASEELTLDLSWEYADYRAVMEGGDVARIDSAATIAEIESLREQVKALGGVNLEAIDEESQLAQRNEDLIRQVADIDSAAAKLTSLIEQLNEASTRRFGDVFARIQERFAGQSGMFRKLFGGGRAEVRLMPLVREVDGEKVETDQVDLLESGIEVIAKPPGKEPRSISQLSGGEKTLTAVALLMAIFQSKPSCFCVLDEVDAALDDANVGRFADVVREFTQHSHFIIITHNKKTMQVTDRLYGVTMQERGVSTRVSVRFEQVGKDGTISEGRPERAKAIAAGAEPAAVNGDALPTAAPEPRTPRRAKGALRRALAGMRQQAETAPAVEPAAEATSPAAS